MYLNPATYPGLPKLYQNEFYSVIENTKKEDYESIDVYGETHLPNYLVVNDKTLAIEYVVDVLPAGIQVSNKLADELSSLTGTNDVERIVN